jgi:hypothetical protein
MVCELLKFRGAANWCGLRWKKPGRTGRRRQPGSQDALEALPVRTPDYADLFQMVEGLRWVFPKALGRLERRNADLTGHRDLVARRPRIVACLNSERRLHVGRQGIFGDCRALDEGRKKA